MYQVRLRYKPTHQLMSVNDGRRGLDVLRFDPFSPAERNQLLLFLHDRCMTYYLLSELPVIPGFEGHRSNDDPGSAMKRQIASTMAAAPPYRPTQAVYSPTQV